MRAPERRLNENWVNGGEQLRSIRPTHADIDYSAEQYDSQILSLQSDRTRLELFIACMNARDDLLLSWMKAIEFVTSRPLSPVPSHPLL